MAVGDAAPDREGVKVVAALTVALVVVLATAPVASAAPTKREFIRKGDAVCADVAHQLLPLRRRAEAAKSLPESKQWAAVADIWTDQVAIQKRFVERFRAIGTPTRDTAAARLVTSLDRGLVLARRVRDGFAKRDERALASALPAYIEFTLALNRRVQAYGFRVCGKG